MGAVQGLLAAPAQVRAPPLGPALGLLLTYGIDGARVQAKFLTAACSQRVQVKARGPLLVPLKRLPLNVVAVIENVVDRARLLVQQAIQRLHAVAVDEDHRVILTALTRLTSGLAYQHPNRRPSAGPLSLHALKDGASRGKSR